MSTSKHQQPYIFFNDKCISCNAKMEFIACSDNPNEGVAYNVYHCYSCLIVVRSDVWDNAGLTWILKDATIFKETLQQHKDRTDGI